MESGGRLTASAVAEMFARNGVRDAEVADFFSFLLGAEGVRDQTLRDAAAEVIEEKTRHAVSRGLELLCAAGPIVFAVEDIHWIDPTSRHLLSELASVIHGYPALLVLTGRPEPAEGALQMPRVTRIQLARLGPEETRNAFVAMWPKSRALRSPGLLEAMDRITAGVPLFIEEICQWMAENQDFTTEQLTQAISPAGASILERVLSARLEPLGPARDVARAAAVVGIRSNLALLRATLPELDEAGLLDGLDRLSEAGLLVRTRSPGDGFYAFRHALIQETIYNATLRKTRRELHGRLFSALEKNREIANWMGIDALAHHAEQAGPHRQGDHPFRAGRQGKLRPLGYGGSPPSP